MVEAAGQVDRDFASLLRIQAGHCARLGSPLYADLLERAAADAEAGGPVALVLRGHEGDPANSMLALRLMGAAHRRVLEGELPDLQWPTFRQALIDDAEAIRLLLDQPVQTNEVGRCAALLPGFLAVSESTDLPLRLLEVGASAGLNLRWDRYRYDADGFSWGDRDSPVRIVFELSGEAPAPRPIEVVERRGCDPDPIDPVSEEGRLTLQSFVWPDQDARVRRLRGALAAAREVPVEVEEAPAAAWVEERIAESEEGVATVVFHSIVMQYLPDDERRRFELVVAGAGEAATHASPLAWLRMEPAGEMAEVRLTSWPGGEERSLARVGYHGNPVLLG
ncbi:MAG TPA: DUF2332 family protein [Solirubrobacterales bacterium]|nr:DUF2332 family protein [Solirubrobacterales bacterium]